MRHSASMGFNWRLHHILVYNGYTQIWKHYSDVMMSAMASQITGVSIVYTAVCSGADQRKHQCSTLLGLVRRIHRWPIKGPVTRKMFPFDEIIINTLFVLKQDPNHTRYWAANIQCRRKHTELNPYIVTSTPARNGHHFAENILKYFPLS